MAALLVLDLASVTGWAYGALGADAPQCGRWELGATDRLDIVGARAACLDNTLAAALDLWTDVTVCGMAEPIPGRNQSDVAAMGAFVGIVRAECWRRRIRVLVQPESTVRKEMLGRGSGRSDVMKGLALQWCERHGISVPDHNAADAVVFWAWCRGELLRQRGGSTAHANARGQPQQMRLPGIPSRG
jgi:hypothetical protein